MGGELVCAHVLHEADQSIVSKQNGVGRAAEAFFENRCLDRSEVSIEFQITIIQIRLGRVLSVYPAFHAPADNEQRHCGSVVGAVTRLLCDAAPEFGKSHGQHPVRLSVRRKVAIEGQQPRTHVRQQAILLSALAHVRVKGA